MNRLQPRKLISHEPDPNPNACLLSNARTGSLPAYGAIRARLRKRVIGERNFGEWDIGKWVIRERDFWEWDIWETVASCRFAE
jgi:hypothetical protein